MRTLYMSDTELGELLEYNSSFPTGTTEGKRWRRRVGSWWWVGEYGKPCDRWGNPDPNGPEILIHWSRVIVVEPKHYLGGLWTRGKNGVSWHYTGPRP
jgi:hypothetical protein